ncbi:MAG TPA: YtxH domain-containing protein [Terriglobales bacterium]|nr:YtxH domain-containing protein [Terriglobales bacterium]
MAENRGLWFLVGLSLGALAGVLYAPQAGEKTREMLRTKAGEGRDRVERTVAEMREQAGSLREHVTTMASNATDRGKHAITRQIDQFQAAVEAGRQAYREAAGTRQSSDQEDTASQV